MISPISRYRSAITEFEKLPFKTPPFDGRNWGSPLHSLCSYQGKLKPAIAHFLVQNFTKPGDTVLDPLSGAGTIPLEAMLTGRRALANDLQELGFILSSAKIAQPNRDALARELDSFLSYVQKEKSRIDDADLLLADFGLNGKISDYFHPENLREVLAARKYIASHACDSVERALVLSAFLHSLHGNRPYALSRTSHPVTPFKPTGEFEYRDFASRIRSKVDRAVGAYPLFDGESLPGEATLGSFEKLKYSNEIDAVIASPPFAASTRFYIANWMRLWAAGWDPDDFNSRKIEFIEEKQKKNFEIYSSFFDSASQWLKPGGKLILHLGKTAKVDMAEELIAVLPDPFNLIHKFDETVVGAEKFGIRDQGATSMHQFLFLMKS